MRIAYEAITTGMKSGMTESADTMRDIRESDSRRYSAIDQLIRRTSTIVTRVTHTVAHRSRSTCWFESTSR